MRHNVSTPGGFFVGLGGIVAFCVVSSLVYLWVKAPARHDDLRAQQTALGLAAAPEAPREEKKKKEDETDVLLRAAADRYNGGKRPNIDQLQELRGVVRYREARKAAEAADKALNAPSSVTGKTVLAAAMDEVIQELAIKKPVASKIALAEMGPADPSAPPMLPNFSGGGVRTLNFVDPNKPSAPPAPATPPQPAPGQQPAPGTTVPAPAPAPANATPAPPPNPKPNAAPPAGGAAPNRPPLLNSSEPK
jgi:hypothetical protein